MAKETFVFARTRDLERGVGVGGGGGGRLSTVFPLIFHGNPASRTFVVAVSRSNIVFLSFFFQ